MQCLSQDTAGLWRIDMCWSMPSISSFWSGCSNVIRSLCLAGSDCAFRFPFLQSGSFCHQPVCLWNDTSLRFQLSLQSSGLSHLEVKCAFLNLLSVQVSCSYMFVNLRCGIDGIFTTTPCVDGVLFTMLYQTESIH
ncbi:hypothetical protein EMCRGX_G017886 [Ephydatia muelleri]